MPEIDISRFEQMTPVDLETLRRSLVSKASGNHENLDDDDLRTLAAVTGVLRRRASGPPKAVKEKSTSRVKAPKAELGDLA